MNSHFKSTTMIYSIDLPYHISKWRMNDEFQSTVRDSIMLPTSTVSGNILRTIRLKRQFARSSPLPSSDRKGMCPWCMCSEEDLYCTNRTSFEKGLALDCEWACNICYPYVCEETN